MSKRQDEWECTSQSPPTVTDQCQKEKMSGNAQVKVHQQWLTNIKTTRRVEAYKSQSTNSDWPVSKRQDEGERTCQSPPTVTDQCEKDTTSRSAKVKVHQQWLTNVKKTRQVEAYKSKFTNSCWPMLKKTRRMGAHKSMSTNSSWPVWTRQDEWERPNQCPWKRTSQSPQTVIDQYQKNKTVKKTRRVGECTS